jgi:hypothetical protein
MHGTTLDWRAIIANNRLMISSADEAKAKNVFPNRLSWIKGEPKIGVVVVFRSDPDFALGKASFEYITAAKREGRIDAGYVLLLENLSSLGDCFRLVRDITRPSASDCQY